MRGYAEGGYVGGAEVRRRCGGLKALILIRTITCDSERRYEWSARSTDDEGSVDMARKGARDEIQAQMRDGGLSPEVDDEDLPLESETRYGCASAPSVRKVRFGDGYSQRAPPG